MGGIERFRLSPPDSGGYGRITAYYVNFGLAGVMVFPSVGSSNPQIAIPFDSVSSKSHAPPLGITKRLRFKEA